MLNGYSDEVPIDLSHILHSNDMKLVRHVKANSYDYISKRIITQSSENRHSSSGRKELTHITESNNNSLMSPPNHNKIFSSILESPKTESTRELNIVREEDDGKLGPYKMERLNENLYNLVRHPKSNFYSPKVNHQLLKSRVFNPFAKQSSLARKQNPVMGTVKKEKYDFILNKKEPNEHPKGLILKSKIEKTYSQILGDVDKEFSAHDVPLARNRLKLSNRYIQKTVDEVFSEANSEFNFPLDKIKRKFNNKGETTNDEKGTLPLALQNSAAADKTKLNEDLLDAAHYNQSAPEINVSIVEVQEGEENGVKKEDQDCSKIKIESDLLPENQMTGKAQNDENQRSVEETGQQELIKIKENKTEPDIYSEFSTITKKNMYEKIEKAIELNPTYYKHITGLCSCRTSSNGACKYSGVLPVVKDPRLFGMSTYSKVFSTVNKDTTTLPDEEKTNNISLNEQLINEMLQPQTEKYLMCKEDPAIKYCSITKSDFVKPDVIYEKPKRYYQFHCKPEGALRIFKTSYQQEFINYGANPVNLIKIKEKPTVISELPFSSETTYKREYRSYEIKRKNSVDFAKLPHPLNSSMPMQNDTTQRLAHPVLPLSSGEKHRMKSNDPVNTFSYDGSYLTSNKIDYPNHFPNRILDLEEFQAIDKDKEIKILKQRIRDMIKSQSKKFQL